MMKRWLLVVLTLLLISGCTLNKFWRWIDDMDWERDDQTIKVIRVLVR